jgi:translation initiation factor IF-3
VAPERDQTRVNERIRIAEIRLIGPDGEQLGVMTPDEGMTRAREVGLDLVEVAPNSRPPVCRIMDYGRYKYEQKKKKSGANKKSHAATLKEVKLRPGTDMHDLDFKLKNARRFLMDGDKVKVTVMFRGREMVHKSRGRAQLDQVVKLLEPLAKMETLPRMEGRFMSMILVGERDAIEAARRVEEAELAAAGVEASQESEAEATAAGDEAIEESEAETAAAGDEAIEESEAETAAPESEAEAETESPAAGE